MPGGWWVGSVALILNKFAGAVFTQCIKCKDHFSLLPTGEMFHFGSNISKKQFIKL